jgi:pilus assembly protein CpaC
MYDNQLRVAGVAGAARPRAAHHIFLVTLAASTAVFALSLAAPLAAQEHDSASIIRKIGALSEKLELTTNTNRILTLDKNIPRVQVNNPELLAVTPLSANQIQISAKKAGVTQVNLWDEEGNIHSVDVMIYGDARELSAALQTQFPNSSIRVYRYSESLVLTGFVDRPDHVGPIMRLAEDYAPKVINNINVGGVQQILLKVKVMEVSRTKLRQLGVDWAYTSAGGGFALNSVTDILRFDGIGDIVTNNNDTFAFGVVNGNDAFFGFLEALQANRVAKILAEPNLVAVSGRPAQFNVGGEFPVLIPQSLGTTSIEYKPYGTQVDFVPIVLGNGNIRLEVRPRVSEIDPARSVELNGFSIPALTVRQIDTAVEMKAGQTFALAGLVQERTETLKRGLPYVSDVPVLGVPFRSTEDNVNEIELLIMVTPEFVDPIDACEAPNCGPGMFTVSPDNCGLYCGGRMEDPAHCHPTRGLGSCGGDQCICNQGYVNGGFGAPCNCDPAAGHGAVLPGGSGYEVAPAPEQMPPANGSGTNESEMPPPVPPAPEAGPEANPQTLQSTPHDLSLPVGAAPPTNPAAGGADYLPAAPVLRQPIEVPQSTMPNGAPLTNAPRPTGPAYQPVYPRNVIRPQNPQSRWVQPVPYQAENRLIGPVGYDVQ